MTERTKKPTNKPGHLNLNGKGNTKIAAKNRAVASKPSHPPAIFTDAPNPDIEALATSTDWPNKFNNAPPATACAAKIGFLILVSNQGA